MFVLTVLICVAGTDLSTCTPENASFASAGNRCDTPVECNLVGSLIAQDHAPRPGEFLKFVLEPK